MRVEEREEEEEEDVGEYGREQPQDRAMFLFRVSLYFLFIHERLKRR